MPSMQMYCAFAGVVETPACLPEWLAILTIHAYMRLTMVQQCGNSKRHNEISSLQAISLTMKGFIRMSNRIIERPCPPCSDLPCFLDKVMMSGPPPILQILIAS